MRADAPAARVRSSVLSARLTVHGGPHGGDESGAVEFETRWTFHVRGLGAREFERESNHLPPRRGAQRRRARRLGRRRRETDELVQHRQSRSVEIRRLLDRSGVHQSRRRVRGRHVRFR